MLSTPDGSQTPKIKEPQLASSLVEGEMLLWAEQSPDIEYFDYVMKKKVSGVLFFTNYQLIFGVHSSENIFKEYFYLPYGYINKIEKIVTKLNENALEIRCKDSRRIVIGVKPNLRDKIEQNLRKMAFPEITQNLFAFSYKLNIQQSEKDGWKVFNIFEEFLRQQVDFTRWRMSDINYEYAISDTYPKKFIVPHSVSDETIQAVAQFRSKGRIPVLCWAHPVTQAVIVRSSQPLVGLKGLRCVADEHLLTEIKNSSVGTLYILDSRPRANAVANQVQGMGYENTDTYYKDCVLEFLNIPNIHVMRESLNKIYFLCQSTVFFEEEKWLLKLDGTHWFDHLRTIIFGARRTVQLLEENNCVLLHCSDGWDRTAQVSSVSQLMLDPYYRSIIGFQVLIEKEWISFGHRFQTRIGHGNKNSEDDQRSPVFVQFVDCVFQLLQQFPCSFEFNEKLLIDMLDALYNCKYGTFLYDCEREREINNVKEKTHSFWTEINLHPQKYTNLFYLPDPSVLKPSYLIQDLVFWKNYFMRWHQTPPVILTKEIRCEMYCQLLESHKLKVKQLEAELQQLKNQQQEEEK